MLHKIKSSPHQHIQATRKKLGRVGESAACFYLTKRGYSIIKRNFFKKTGEIDIIAKKNSFLVFIEVKTRKHKPNFPSSPPALSVTPLKIKRVKQTAVLYLKENQPQNYHYRFDIISIVQTNNLLKLKHIPYAF